MTLMARSKASSRVGILRNDATLRKVTGSAWPVSVPANKGEKRGHHAFGIVGLLSIIPTVRFISWNRQAGANPSFLVPAAELASVKTYIRAEAFIFLLIPVFAAAMARGYGY
jgi:hypothetical protein